jgi:hypothetical protein
MNRLALEFAVFDIQRALRFYRQVVECEVLYEYPEDTGINKRALFST